MLDFLYTTVCCGCNLEDWVAFYLCLARSESLVNWVGGELATCLEVTVGDAVLKVRGAQPLERRLPHGDLPGLPKLRRRLAGLHH